MPRLDRDSMLQLCSDDCCPHVISKDPKMLIVAPHPDDEIIACGGIIQNAIRNAIGVSIVVITDGTACYGHETLSPKLRKSEIGRIRQSESLQAGKYLGLGPNSYSWAQLPDGQLESEDWLSTVSRRVTSVIERVRPQVVFIPSGVDRHSDHRVVSRACKASLKSMPQPARAFEYVVWKTEKSTEVDGGFVYVLSRGERAAKRDALMMFRSQIMPPYDGAKPVLSEPSISQWIACDEVFLNWRVNRT